MKKKVISTIIALIMLILLKHNVANAATAQQISQMGSESVGQKVTVSFSSDMNTTSNNLIYCISQGQHNSGSTEYKVLTYIEIESGAATVWDVNGLNGATTGQCLENKVLAEILSGNYGATGYGTASNYSPTQRGLYYYWGTWISKVGPSIGTDTSWSAANGYSDNGVGADVVSKATAAVQGGANPSVKIYLLDNWEAKDSWQRLLIAVSGGTTNSKLTIIKEDDETGKKLANVKFVIKNADGEYLQAQVVNSANNEFVALSFGNAATEFYTNSSGQIVITGLASGKYTIMEKANPNKTADGKDYIDTDQEQSFLMGANASQTITIYNTPPDDDDEFVPTPKEGNVTLSGRVWEDLLRGKANTTNGTIDSDEKGVAGVKVYWKTSSGTVLASTTTDSNGNYTMRQGITIYNHTYRIDTNKYNQLNNSYIEFEYNGLKYTTVKLGTSKGVEDEGQRAILDGKFNEVTANEVKDGGYRLSYSTGGNSAQLNQSITDFLVSASTKSQVSNLLDNAAKGTSSYCIADCPSHDKHGTHTYYEWCSHHEKYHKRSHYNCTEARRTDSWTITNINLGLVQREQPDIALTSDINRVRVIMKGQEYTYYYNSRGIQSNEELFDYKVKFGSKYTNTYKRPVNPSDIAYINYAGNKNEMEVYVTYQIIVKNQSNTLQITVGEIVNYYDNRYEIQTSGWSDKSKYGSTYNKNGFKAAYTTQLSGQILQPGEKSSIIELEFKVKPETVKSIIDQDILLKNISEINIYTTYYGTGTRCSEGRVGVSAGQQYAGIDLDSAPGNAIPGTKSTYEDDTDEAPTFMLTKDPNYKVISGTVWEDTDTNTSDNERLGDGIKSSSEKGVANVKVELLKVNDDGTTEPAYLYYVGSGAQRELAVTYTDANGDYSFGSTSSKGIVVDNYIIKYTYGDDINGGASTINGNAINARNYKSTIITTEPVKGVMNGSNKSTMWHLTTTDNASIAVDDLDLRKTATDDKSLTYSNYNDKINMSAYTKPFEVQLEYTVDQSATVDSTTGKNSDFKYDWQIFDFGIIERPREDIVIDKSIANLKITLANGQVLTEGDPRTETLSYTKALGIKKSVLDSSVVKNHDRDSFKSNSEKRLAIEMDSELIQGARLDIVYEITVTNNSEQDYEYSKDKTGYYYYGNKAGLNLISSSVEYVADYMDSELTCTVGTEATNDINKDGWRKYSAKELYDAGNISEKTKNALEAGDYLIFVTDAFKNIPSGSSKTKQIFASKLLANQATDYTYENHAEIIQLNGKIARTIDSVETNNRTQVTKTYKPGTYIPSLARVTASTPIDGTIEQAGLHNQDDDMIVITITPPTGLENNIMIYIIAGTVALVILVGGIFIIKKKVL